MELGYQKRLIEKNIVQTQRLGNYNSIVAEDSKIKQMYKESIKFLHNKIQ